LGVKPARSKYVAMEWRWLEPERDAIRLPAHAARWSAAHRRWYSNPVLSQFEFWTR
jgi:hypothetical protein